MFGVEYILQFNVLLVRGHRGPFGYHVNMGRRVRGGSNDSQCSRPLASTRHNGRDLSYNHTSHILFINPN